VESHRRRTHQIERQADCNVLLCYTSTSRHTSWVGQRLEARDRAQVQPECGAETEHNMTLRSTRQTTPPCELHQIERFPLFTSLSSSTTLPYNHTYLLIYGRTDPATPHHTRRTPGRRWGRRKIALMRVWVVTGRAQRTSRALNACRETRLRSQFVVPSSIMSHAEGALNCQY
jgi:hypothetical protein